MTAIFTPTNLIITTDSPMPFIPSISITHPVYLNYPDLNTDPRIHKRLTNKYYYLTLDKWLYGDLQGLLNYLVVNGDKVELIKKLSDFNSHAIDKDTQETTDKKVDFIENVILSKHNVRKVLNKLVTESGINWYDFPKNNFIVKQAIKKYLKHKFRKYIQTQ
jgi:hypothetical protein